MLKKLKNLISSKKTPPNYYSLLGEQQGIKDLVDKFYQVMEEDPKAINCLNSHELIDVKIPDSIKEKLCDFISGWLGGPNLFIEKYGHPRMRQRHMHVKITEIERDEWLYCMNMSLKFHPSKKLRDKNKISLANSFGALAIRIQNS